MCARADYAVMLNDGTCVDDGAAPDHCTRLHDRTGKYNGACLQPRVRADMRMRMHDRGGWVVAVEITVEQCQPRFQLRRCDTADAHHDWNAVGLYRCIIRDLCRGEPSGRARVDISDDRPKRGSDRFSYSLGMAARTDQKPSHESAQTFARPLGQRGDDTRLLLVGKRRRAR